MLASYQLHMYLVSFSFFFLTLRQNMIEIIKTMLIANPAEEPIISPTGPDE